MKSIKKWRNERKMEEEKRVVWFVFGSEVWWRKKWEKDRGKRLEEKKVGK